MMRYLLLFCSVGVLWAQLQMNVQQLADFLRSELALRQHTDKQIGASVRKLQLSERLTDKTILDLQAQGAGPKTVEALRALRDQTASMKQPTHDATYSPGTAPEPPLATGPATATLTTKAPPTPPPNSVDYQRILDAMREYALNYTQTLPNFVCVQVTRQYVDPNAGDNYRSLGTILAKVSYKEGREKYSVYSVGGRMVDTTMENVRSGGAVSSGEFGSMMREIFEPKSSAEFAWDHWATLRGRRLAVFNYFIDSGHSSFSISYGNGPSDTQRIITAYRGLVYADPQTGEIARIKFVAVDIPSSFPVKETTDILDYDLVDIGGQKFVCPLMAKLWMRAGRESARNEIEFRSYRKFGSDSSIVYDDSPLPASKTEEQPAEASKPAPAAPAPTAQKPATSSSPWGLPTPPPPPPQ